jgi:hypothetical protein
MKIKHFALIHLGIAYCLVLSACGPGRINEPTLTPTPTQTQTLTPTPTNTLTPTPDPMVIAMQGANQLWISKDGAGAISKYGSILQQSAEPSIRTAVFAKLEEIGSVNLQQANLQYQKSGSHEDIVKACETYKLALSAYAPILKAQDRPAFEQDPFYTNAAWVDVALINCHLWEDEPPQSYNEVINSSLDNLALYPDKPAIMNILVPAIVNTYKDMAQSLQFGKNNVSQQEVFSTGQAIIKKVGGYDIDGRKAAGIITSALAEVAVCSENHFTFPNVDPGTSTTKKVESCPLFGQDTEIDEAGLRATDPSEIWFVLTGTSVKSNDLRCTVSYKGKSYSYTYSGQSNDVYSLKDVHTGKVVASKTFYGVAPRCVFTNCSLNTLLNTAACVGGEGHSTFDKAVLIQWMKGMVK